MNGATLVAAPNAAISGEWIARNRFAPGSCFQIKAPECIHDFVERNHSAGRRFS